jgi:Phage integrase family
MAQPTVLRVPVGGRARPVINSGAERPPSWHRLGPGHMSFVAKRSRHRAIAVPIVPLVFPGPDGGYLPRPRSTSGWFATAVRQAKVQAIAPHDLRHTCASLAISAGVNVLALQRMLGHTSARSRWTPTPTCSTPIWTRSRSPSTPGTRERVWPKCGHRGLQTEASGHENGVYQRKRGKRDGGGGGI